jgi:hypothetical protein
MVIELAAGPPKRDREKELALRRHAIQLAAQLPESEEDALAVLRLAETLVRSFLGGPRPV